MALSDALIALNGSGRIRRHLNIRTEETANPGPKEIQKFKDEHTNTDTKTTKVWSLSSYFSFSVVNYTIQKFIKDKDINILVNKEDLTVSFQYDYDKQTEILIEGQWIFSYNGKIVVFTTNTNTHTISLKSNADISELTNILDKEIKERNPLKRKSLQIVDSRDGIICIFKNVPQITFNDVILDKNIKEDIYDNTIYHLKNLDGNNGIILYGAPGTGKSLACQAIISEAIKEGYSTAFTTSRVYYTALNEFVELFLSPCVLIFEDIDSFGQSRENVVDGSGSLSDFLQFLSGVYDRKDKMVFVATTNYLEHLDKAITNRPMRFNRKFEFKHPKNTEIDGLIKYYFPELDINPATCYDIGFTGSHIKELQRTCNLLSKKEDKPIVAVFDRALELVKENFTVNLLNKVGF